MAQTIARPRSTGQGPNRSGGSGFVKLLLFIVVAAVLGGVGYLALTDRLPGQQPQSAPSASHNPPVLIGEDPAFQFMTGDDGAPRVRACDPQIIIDTKRCDDLKIMIMDAERMPWITMNISLAWATGRPSLLHRQTDGFQQRRDAVCGEAVFKKNYRALGGECDEFPFAKSAEGGTTARAEEVPGCEQRSQGGTVSTTYQFRPIAENEEFLVIITHPDKIATSPWTGQEAAATCEG